MAATDALIPLRARPGLSAQAPILLVTPPSIFLLDERVFISLGLLRVAAVLEQAGASLEVLDLSGISDYLDALEAHLKKTPAKTIGITATTPQLPAATKIVERIRAVRPDMRILCGGPHVTLVWAAVKLEKKHGRVSRAHRALANLEALFDVLVAGDGEAAIFEAIKPDAPKIVDGDEPGGGLFMTNATYEDSPPPARHLVDVMSYRYSIEGHRATSLIAQLGCLAAGTQIRLGDGRSVPIEDVRVGDDVLCWNETAARFETGPVVIAHTRDAVDLWRIRTGCATTLITSEHPVWTDVGWKTIEALEAGKDRIGKVSDMQPTATGQQGDQRLLFDEVVAKEWVGASRVYNLTVCPGHSYIANGLVVHNCPFGCGFCGGRNSKMLRKIRTRSTGSIVREVEYLHKTYGFTGFMLHDDELNVSKSLVELMNALSDLQAELGTEFRLRGFVKAELFNEEQAVAMYRAGFRWLLCGFEGAHERILTNIQKRATIDDNTRVMEIATKHDLKVKALMSVGHPGESEETIGAVRDWLCKVKPADFDCTIITPYPGSPYYDEAVAHSDVPDAWTYTAKSGDRLHAFDVDYTVVADYYKGDPDGGYHSYVFTDYISRDDLVRQRDALERDVRTALGIPFYQGVPARRYEHSMGQGALPDFILRTSNR